MTITIKNANRNDLGALLEVCQKLNKAKDLDYFERCLDLQSQGKRELLIAEKDGAPCAYGILNWVPKYGLYKRLGIAEIQDLNTIPAARRQGVASAMIAHCEGLARKKGHSDIGISFGLDASFGAAQRLYIKLGYVPDGQGLTYDRKPVHTGAACVNDNDLCLMLIKIL